MKAKVKQDCGVYGLPTHSAGMIVEVKPFVGPYGDVCPDLFQDESGYVWKAELLDFSGADDAPST